MTALTCRLGLGVRPDMPWIAGLALHLPSMFLVDPEAGRLLGKSGEPVGTTCPDGYVRLGRRRGCREQYAHRFVWEAVHGPLRASQQVDHRNSVKSDNRIANLDAVTRVENCRRALVAGRWPMGERSPNARLTDDLVRQIRRSRRPTRQWARELGVDAKTVRLAR